MAAIMWLSFAGSLLNRYVGLMTFVVLISMTLSQQEVNCDTGHSQNIGNDQAKPHSDTCSSTRPTNLLQKDILPSRATLFGSHFLSNHYTDYLSY